MQCMHSFSMFGNLIPIHIFMKQFVQQSCYLEKSRRVFGVVLYHTKKRLNHSKVGRLQPLLNCFSNLRVGSSYLQRQHGPIIELWKSKCTLFDLACRPAFCKYYSTQKRCCLYVAADHKKMRILSKYMVKYIHIGPKYLIHQL